MITDSLGLSAQPLDITAVNDNYAIVTLPEEQTLQYINLYPELSELTLGHTLLVDGECMSVAVVNGDLYVHL